MTHVALICERLPHVVDDGGMGGPINDPAHRLQGAIQLRAGVAKITQNLALVVAELPIKRKKGGVPSLAERPVTSVVIRIRFSFAAASVGL